MTRVALQELYRRLLASYGPQGWWPGDGSFEVMVGAVLTQNTAWGNVERAIANLRSARALDPEALLALPEAELAALLRPSGYFNVKARRLRALCRWYVETGGWPSLAGTATADLRRGLLGVHGIGPETADDILLYAFERPVFVVDAYTRRLFGRLGLARGDEPYDVLRLGVEGALGPDVSTLNEFHALIVRHGKDRCRPRPVCERCPAARGCLTVPGRRPGGSR